MYYNCYNGKFKGNDKTYNKNKKFKKFTTCESVKLISNFKKYKFKKYYENKNYSVMKANKINLKNFNKIAKTFEMYIYFKKMKIKNDRI